MPANKTGTTMNDEDKPKNDTPSAIGEPVASQTRECPVPFKRLFPNRTRPSRGGHRA